MTTPPRGFTDQDLQRLKERMELVGPDDLFHPLIHRLECAEKILNKAIRYQYDDGVVIYDMNISTKDLAELMEAWRKSKETA